MHRFAVCEKYHSQVATIRIDVHPAANATVLLNELDNRRSDSQFDPRIEDAGSIGPFTNVAEVGRCLQFGRMSVRCLTPAASIV